MNIKHGLREDRTFLCDTVITEDNLPLDPDAVYWTGDQVPLGMWAPAYVGGTINHATKEVTGGAWSDPGAPSAPTAAQLLVEARATAYLRNNQAYDEATLLVTKSYPQSEKDTWPTQDREIKAYQADPEAAITPWIDTAAQHRGIARAVYIEKTLLKIAQFEQISAYLTGRRQGYEDQIKTAMLPAVINAMTFNYPLG